MEQESASITFGKRLRELRQACRWTQEKAAEACGIGYKLYQLYELGIKRNPGLVTLEKIARGFGLGIHELLAPPPLPRTRPRKSFAASKAKPEPGKRQARRKC
ncbi:MAG: helix-turn-helix transcriptional regulator [bacterium]